MRKVILLLCLTVLILPTMFALSLNVQQTNNDVAMITNLPDYPATFNVQIQNLGPSNNLQFYNLLGFQMAPIGTVPIAAGETKNVTVLIYPRTDLTYTGLYTFNYIIQGNGNDQLPQSLTFKIMNLQDAFTVGASEINPTSNTITIYIKNNANFNFQNANINFNSPFFSLSEQTPIGPYQEKDFQVTLNKADFKSLLAGFYTLSAEVTADGQVATVQGNINFAQQNVVNVSEKNYGFLVATKVIDKTNVGNVVANSQTVITKNIISRLFTTFSPAPDIVDRQGLLVYYTWENQIQPGDNLHIEVTTNWVLPFIIILLVAVIVVLVRIYTRRSLVLEKKVTFLRSKGGEFAMRVTVVAHAKKFIERVTLTERIPSIVKPYNQFGGEKPTRINEHSRTMEWYFDRLQPGEKRIFSYIIYSKVGVLGRFALPTTKAMYEKDGKVHEAESNRAYLITEQFVEKNR